MKVKVLGIDCSLNNLGISVAEVDEFLKVNVLKTKLFENKLDLPKRTSKTFEDYAKAKNFAEILREIILKENINIAIMEIPCGSQSSRACTSAGIVTGLAGSVACYVNLVGVTPTDAKKATGGLRTASKEDIIHWVAKTHPEVLIPTRIVNGESHYLKKFEHEADSIAIIEAGITKPDFVEYFSQHKERIESV